MPQTPMPIVPRSILLTGLLLFWALSPASSTSRCEASDEVNCGYYMCQYERGNIDALIVEFAKRCQTVMFGEIHDTVLEGAPSPVEDSLYVVSLLPGLRAIGYNYLALEADKHAAIAGHSRDLVRFYNDYRQAYPEAAPSGRKYYTHAKPGWIGLVRSALDLGFEIRFIDVPNEQRLHTRPRDLAMFENLKAEIFDGDKDARVVVYIGANHVGESETHMGVYLYKGKRRPLGYYLDAYTGGRNFSVYMGHTYDTPEGCDLFISDFIWETYRDLKHLGAPAD